MDIVPYNPAYARQIADLHHDSVHGAAHTHYSPEQLEAWAPTPPDYGWWEGRLAGKQPFVALQDSQVLGFIELDDDGHIDCLYTHRDFQRRGVATRLYLHAEGEARKSGMSRLFVEASLLARPFFEKHGFRVLKQNRVLRHGVALTNFSMEKHLDDSPLTDLP